MRNSPPSPLMTRRRFLTGLGATAVGLTTVGYGMGLLTPTPVLERVTLPLPPGVSDNVRGITIGFLSDLHLGPWMSKEQALGLLAPLVPLKPDLLILGGDYLLSLEGIVSRTLSRVLHQVPRRSDIEVYHEVGSLISESFTPPMGIYAVLGNHDRWAHPDQAISILSSYGIKVLVNSAVYVPKTHGALQLVGVDDFWTGAIEVAKIPQFTVDPIRKTCRILVSHNPDGTTWCHTRGGKFNLALSGHTHGGQIKLPLLGPIFRNCQSHNLFEGLVHTPEFTSYTSRGLGMVELPCRINCPPELTLLTLS